MNILAVNWLDLENPQAGGAEVHFFEIFGRLVERGHRVTLVSSGWKGAPPREKIAGIEVRRFGGRHTFALHGRGAVRRILGEQTYDIVVEDINKLPLFTTSLTRLPVYVIIPHLFGTTAFREASFPIASVVWLAERPIPRAYRRAAFHAISESTRDDLVARGVPESSIKVIHPGVDTTWFVPTPDVLRAETPTFLYVGRLKRYKGIDMVIRALAAVRKAGHDVRLEIAGRGDDAERLQGVAARLQLGSAVQFLGFVDEAAKRDLLRRAWAVVFPSEKEGWGIVNVEAAACGTPAIASDSPGLRESVIADETGVLIPHGATAALTDALIRFSTDRELLETLGRGARAFAERLSWERTADETEEHLSETLCAAQAVREG